MCRLDATMREKIDQFAVNHDVMVELEYRYEKRNAGASICESKTWLGALELRVVRVGVPQGARKMGGSRRLRS